MVLVAAISQALNTLAWTGFSWARWGLAVTLLALWSSITFIVGRMTPDGERRYAFWWALSVPLLGLLPLSVISAVAELADFDPIFPITLWGVAFAGLVLVGGGAVIALWGYRRSSQAKRIFLDFPASSDTKSDLSRPHQFKLCPMCAEEIKMAAVKCKHCGSDLRTTSGDGFR